MKRNDINTASMLTYYLSLSLRRSYKNFATTVLICLTLAIGIAACITAFSIFISFQGEALPGVTSHLYVVTMDSRTVVSTKGSTTYKPDSLLKLRDAKYLVNKQGDTTQAALAVSYVTVQNMSRMQSYSANALLAYGRPIQLLGISLLSGRSWSTQEELSGDPVVVVGQALAFYFFGSDKVVGRIISINDQNFRIIGVYKKLKPSIEFVDAQQYQDFGGLDFELIMPVGAALDADIGPTVSDDCDNSDTRRTYGKVDIEKCNWLEVWAGLHTINQRGAYLRLLNSYAKDQVRIGRFVYQPNVKLFGTRQWVRLNGLIPSAVKLNLFLSLAFLVLCMSNVIGLLTARFMSWRTDSIVRRALGASRLHLYIQYIVESGLLGLIGGFLALPLTMFGVWVVHLQSVKYADAAKFNFDLFIMLLIFSVTIGVVVGLYPAWRITRLPLGLQIKQD